MAIRTIYLVIRMNIENPNTDEISDEDIDHIVTEIDYCFNSLEDFRIDTDIVEFTSDNYPWS